MSIEDCIKRWTVAMSHVEQAACARDAESLQAWLSVAQECRLAAGSRLCERLEAGGKAKGRRNVPEPDDRT
jgi:hypothetical protein